MLSQSTSSVELAPFTGYGRANPAARVNPCRIHVNVASAPHKCNTNHVYYVRNSALESVMCIDILVCKLPLTTRRMLTLTYDINNADFILGYQKQSFPLASIALKLPLYKILACTMLKPAAPVWDSGLATFPC